MVKRFAAIGSIILSASTLAGILYPHIHQKWSYPPYVVMPALLALVLGTIWLFAYIYEHRAQMFQYECRGETLYNSYMIDHFSPWEEMCFRFVHLPMLKAVYEQTKNEELLKYIKIVEKWFDQGYIDKKYFPKNIKKFVEHIKQTRF